MAIEIDEMVVRASTGQAAQADALPETGGAGGAVGLPDLEEMKEALLAECRQMLLELLADREER